MRLHCCCCLPGLCKSYIPGSGMPQTAWLVYMCGQHCNKAARESKPQAG